jgi:hypothetical protein
MLSNDVAIREAEVGDMPALLELADLDSRPLPDGRMLVAEVHGEIVAALGQRTGAVIADPFLPTAELQQLLKLRAAQVAPEMPQRHGLLHALSPRRAL